MFLARCCSDNLCVINFDREINHKNERDIPRQKMERKVGKPEYLFRKVSYISSECLYVPRFRNIALGIHDDANQTSGLRGRTPILHLHVVVENNVRKHDLELASSEVASRMTPASERQEVRIK